MACRILGKCIHPTFHFSRVSSTRRAHSAIIPLQFLDRGPKAKIAYKRYKPKSQDTDTPPPGVMFCSGFQSTMDGIKAQCIEKYCINQDLSFIRFDYQGCGHSAGDVRDILFSTWKEDLAAILDQLTSGPQRLNQSLFRLKSCILGSSMDHIILWDNKNRIESHMYYVDIIYRILQIMIGSSMGAWLMMLVAMERPHRVQSIIGLASAPDFTHRAYARFSPEIVDLLEEKGEIVIDTEYHQYVVTKRFIEDTVKFNLLHQKRIPILCPVRLLHGMEDIQVPYKTSLQLAEKLASDDVTILLRKKGDHRLSKSEDIEALFEQLSYLLNKSNDCQQLATNIYKEVTAESSS